MKPNVEAWQPDPGARPRWEDKDSNQGCQSTRSGIGLVHRRRVLGFRSWLRRSMRSDRGVPGSGPASVGRRCGALPRESGGGWAIRRSLGRAEVRLCFGASGIWRRMGNLYPRTLNVVARRRRTHRAKRTRELIRRCHPRRVRLVFLVGFTRTGWIDLWFGCVSSFLLYTSHLSCSWQ